MYCDAKEISKDENNFRIIASHEIKRNLFYLILKSKNRMQCEGTKIIFPIDINEFDEIFFVSV